MSLDQILARQAGVVTRAQALGAGLTAAAVDHRVRRRHWRPLHPSVYLVAGHRYDDEAALRAALLWAGAGAVLSGGGAAWWHGVADRVPAEVGVTVSPRRHPRDRPGVSLRRRDLHPEDVVVHRGLRATALPLTVLEAAVELGADGGALLDRALQRHVPCTAVHAAHRRNLGATGSAAAGRLLAAAADRSAAATARLLERVLRGSGSTGWVRGLPVLGHPVDVAFPAARVAIEVEGWARHPDEARASVAGRRRTALVRAGWSVLRCGWHDLVDRPRGVLAEIAHVVARGMSSVP